MRLPRRFAKAHYVCFAVAVLVTGCDAHAPADVEGVSVRDSSGVRIVENTAPVWTAETAWTVGPELVRIGALAGARHETFNRIGDVGRLSDGRIIVADIGDQEIRFFDANGGFINAVGGRGAGPGEFRSISWMGATEDDTIFVWDMGLMRLSVFDDVGRFVRSHQHPGPEFSLRVRDVLPDGRLLAHFPRSPTTLPPPGTVMTDSATLWAYDPLALTRDSITTGPAFDLLLLSSDGPLPVEGFRIPFTEGFGATQHAGRVYVVDRSGWQIRIYEPNWRLTEIWRYLREPEPVTPDEIEFLQRFPSFYFPHTDDPQRVLRAMRIPGQRAVFDWVAVDAEGNVWAQESPPFGVMFRQPTPEDDPRDPQQRLTVFDAGGTLLGEIKMPAGFWVRQIGSDFVLGLELDEHGVHSVVVYQLHGSGQ